MKKKPLKPLKAKYVVAENNNHGGVFAMYVNTLTEARRCKKDFGWRIFPIGKEVE